MAGQRNKHEALAKAEARISELEARNRELESLLAAHMPDKVLEGAPPDCPYYVPELCDKVRALGIKGNSPAMMRSALGITEKDWSDWKQEHPAFAAAIERATTDAKAYFDKLAHDATQRGDWRFPYQQIKLAKAQLTDDDDTAKGDASALVRVDARPGPSQTVSSGPTDAR